MERDQDADLGKNDRIEECYGNLGIDLYHYHPGFAGHAYEICSREQLGSKRRKICF